MLKVVLDGGPGTGKTSVINELKSRGFNVAPEAARIVLKRKIYREDQYLDKKELKQLQKEIWNLSIKDYRSSLKTKKNHVLFFDRGVFSGLSYMILGKIQVPKKMLDQANLVLYDYVFIMKPLPKSLYINDKVRRENYNQSKKIQEKIIQAYKKFGYKPILVPFLPIKKRAEFILKRIRKESVI